MRDSIRKRNVFFLASLMLMLGIPLLCEGQVQETNLTRNGPYLEKLVFNVISSDDRQVLALQNNDIDLIYDKIHPSYIPELSESENIELTYSLRNGYGILMINCAKYPFNITAFRRALAFAIDKQRISDDVFGGLSQPQDSCVAAVNPFSIEDQLPTTYYEANVALGNQLLDAAGFADHDLDGVREAPDGSEFDVLIECAISSNVAIDIGAIAAETLVALGVDATYESTDFYEYLNRLNFHGDYDICFLGYDFRRFDVDWLAYEYWSEHADEPYFNAPGFRNASYDGWRNQLLHSTEYSEVYEAAIEMQRIWIHESPGIICYENIYVDAKRTDRFEGFVCETNGIAGWWTNQKARLKSSEGGPFGGTLRISSQADIDSFNHMVTNTVYAGRILFELYDSLLRIDPDGNDMMGLAEGYSAETHSDNPAVPEGFTRFAFDIIQNATWTDGQPLTAEDIAFALNYYRDTPGNLYGVDITDMTAAYAPTAYTLVVEFNSESYWHLHTIGYKLIIPKHSFTDIGLEGWNTWNPIPPIDAMVTSGPYNVTNYIAGEFIELTRNPNYFYGLDRSLEIQDTTTTNTSSQYFTLMIISGAVGAASVILIGGSILIRKK